MFFPRIKALREEFEYTQQYVADYLDIKRTTYAGWETGHIILPLNIADELAILYNVPISYGRLCPQPNLVVFLKKKQTST